MGLSLSRSSSVSHKLRGVYPKKMLLFIWLMILAPAAMIALPGCAGVDETPLYSPVLPVTDLTSNSVRRLNTDVGLSTEIVWSPDGNMLFYKSGDWVYAARADGTGIDKLVQVSSKDIFSTGEGKLLYTRTVSPQTGDEVYEMGLENRQSQKIGELNIAGYYDLKAWSPDGSKIFYTKTVNKVKKTFIWDLDADKSTYVCDLPRTPDGFHIIVSEPSWSPDGKYIAWVQPANSKRESEGIVPGDTIILLIDIEKGECTELVQIGGLTYARISWSPDSERLLYAKPLLQSGTYQTALWSVDLQGNEECITRMSNKYIYGVFGPDRGKVTRISYDPNCVRVLRNVTFEAATPEDRTQISILDTDGMEKSSDCWIFPVLRGLSSRRAGHGAVMGQVWPSFGWQTVILLVQTYTSWTF